MSYYRWPDTGRFRSILQGTSWLWFFGHGDGMRRLMHSGAAIREMPVKRKRKRGR